MISNRYSLITKLVIGSLGVGFLGLSSKAPAETASAVFNFTATFVGGTCEISAPASVQLSNGGNPFRSSDIEQKIAATHKSFNLTLSKCAGWGLTPSIKVSGQKTSDFGQTLFRDVMGPMDANGYGILLQVQTGASTTFANNTNLATNGVIVAKSDWSTNAQLSTIDTNLKINAFLRCGDCNYPGRQGGALKATVTFDFVYD